MGEAACRKIRNICILAHVDHGKTTLADHLIAACGGGVLHPKLAGRLRFMDYLDEEQRRAITMKSSSIALRYKDFSVNLIDSPGHMDFCSEVSTAARLSDGALILVDAVEGVHIQTHAVLRQAWVEKLTPCLVLNKIDRLITELKLSPMEAYNRLQRIVHEVNGIVSAYKSEKYLSDVDSLLAGVAGEVNLESVEDDEEDVFQPQKGNVAFVCALDGWGFCLSQFAEFYASKLGASMTALLKGLWGPRYYNTKTMMIVGKKGMEGVSKDRQPMFVQFVLRPVWQVYQATLEEDGGKRMLEKVVKTFNLSVPPRELQNKDPRVVLQAVMSRWLPLSDSILSMVVKCMPDPVSSQSARISRLLPKRELVVNDTGLSSDVVAEAEHVRKCVEACDSSSDAPCVAFVSKMFAVPYKMLPQRGSNGEALNNQPTDEVGESEECFLAFARIFSGVLHSGQKVFVLSALYDPLKGESMQRHVQEAELQHLYLMMGQGLKPVFSASAGNVVAIQGLGQYILKSATLSSTRNSWPFSSLMFQVAPTLRVAIEPSDPADMGALMRGLRLLNHADPFVEVTVSSRGEQVLAAAGEVHLDRCIKDLRERFAKVSLEVSPPLVSYKETIEGEGFALLENAKALSSGTEHVEKTTPNGRCIIRVQVMKLPGALTKVFEDSADILGDIIEGKSVKRNGSLNLNTPINDGNSVATLRKHIIDAIESEVESLSAQLDKEKTEKYRKMWYRFLQRIWSLGPRQIGPNILLIPDLKAGNLNNSSQDQKGILVRGSCDVSRRLGFLDVETDTVSIVEDSKEETESVCVEAEALKNSIVSGFQLATAAGPLCDEPLWGLAFLVEPYIFPDNSGTAHQPDQYGIFSGQVMTAVKEACRAAVLQNKPRLVEAMYFCELNTPTEYLGSMYAVLARRRARVLKEEMQEGSALFTVHAYVPVAESFGFADELRRWTSGGASALLVLSHWEALSEDPFFVPKTAEEIEEFGDGSSVPPNIARKLMNSVRRRKGLPVEEKVVQHATKQRTLARKV
ncbi:LOW QUALITY PROTEIN: elongation factor-like GTPase 1 [Phoenix dactylifera]|uniref:Elongation factor-like 1 n=1 Tax=Phoenix dactylifera TaxID=42345 RepID=A0A8B7CZF3_PHODC|nr:LOW QUALITY PROTEIN: elongation factor-like GTPase 1 [Phoenix dactylifera]